MVQLILTVVAVIAVSFIYGYFQELNPGPVTIHLSPTTAYELSPAYLVLISIAGGSLIVAILVGIREAKTLIVNWRTTRLRRREEKVAALHRQGTHAFLSKRIGEAIKLFEKALALDPRRTDSLLWLGNVHRSQKNYIEAIRLHRSAQSVDGHNFEILLELAKDLQGAMRFEEARQALQEILKLDPSNLTALSRQRDLLIRLENWSDALEIQQRVLKTSGPDQDQPAETRHLVGITYEVGRQLLERGHPDKARRYFRTAMKRDRTFLPAYIGLCEVLIHEGKSKQAGQILRKVYFKTSNIIILRRLEELYLEIGEPEEIIRVYQQAIQQHPQDPVPQFYLGNLYYRLEMVDEALHLLSALEGPQDQLDDYHKIMANLYLRKQQMDMAVEELQKALALRKRVVIPYQCTACRYQAQDWAGRCRSCGQWNTYAALPWVTPANPAPSMEEQGVEARAIPYQSLASPFETV